MVQPRFVLRGVLFAIPVGLFLFAVGFAVLIWRYFPAPDPTPLPPVIDLPSGEVPTSNVGFETWVHYQPGAQELRSSGFLLRLKDGRVVGVTVAHSFSIGDPTAPLGEITFRVDRGKEIIARFYTLHGPPGQPRLGEDFTVDYVLMQPAAEVDHRFVLLPDPRGAPQPGERVCLFSGVGSVVGGPRIFEGTVQSESEQAVWVLMDGLFNPGTMSGSPFVSQHSGKAVGMVVAGTIRGKHLFLGAHPVGSLVRLAEQAASYPEFSEFTQ